MTTTDLAAIARDLNRDLRKLSFGPPVTHVYNPAEYAWETYAAYLEKYGRGEREVLLFGMNPGPWGMAQTGVPFGEVEIVRGWLGIEGKVGRPKEEHPKRPITGFECARSEVSGARIWGWAREKFGTPERFFSRFFIANYCPLCFMEESGKNRTPDKIPVAEREPLLEVCDRAIGRTIEVLKPRYIVGVGAWAESRARAVAEANNLTGIVIGRILHPSPASPKANVGWADSVGRELGALGIDLSAGSRS